MTDKTKHYLILGGGLVVAVSVAIVVYKKYQANSSASQAAAEQQSNDELAYLEASSLDSPYGYDDSDSGDSIALPSSDSSDSLAQELESIECLFGEGTDCGSSSSSSSSGSGSGSGSGSSSSGSSGSGSGTTTTSSPSRFVPAGTGGLGRMTDESGDVALESDEFTEAAA